MFKASVFITIFILILLTGCSSKHPSDRELIDNWKTHQAEFEQLHQMFLADKGLDRVGHDFTWPSDPAQIGVTPARLSEYRQLFQNLNLTAGIAGGGAKEIVMFIASTKGLSVTGSSKGYAYAIAKPPLVVEDLETYWSKDGRSFAAFKHIEGNWYLYFDYED